MLDLSRLNPPQREAVTTIEGPLLVLAGAGSGKTRVIAHRAAYLIVNGVPPEAILAVTFTHKAADEMQERVTALAGAAGAEIFVSTFHGFGLWLLREEHRLAGLPRRFAICDAGDQLALVKRCMREVKVDDRSFDAQRVLALISGAKNTAAKGRGTPRFDTLDEEYALIASEVYPRYQRALRAQRAVDFDDLIALPVELLRAHPAVRDRYRARFRHLLVDEYQDTNLSQLELVKSLAGPEGNLCAVGDDDQAIYGWRGAEVKNLLRFGRHFRGAREVRLEQNYRSTGRILECANAVIAKNPDRKPKRLWTAAGAGEPVRVAVLEDEEAEARWVAEEIARGRAEGRPASHFAVLYRLNAQSRPFEEALREGGIPYLVQGGPSFFDRSEVRDLLAYLKICANPEDEVSLSRIVNVPPRGIGDASLEKVQAFAVEKGAPLFEALQAAPEIADLPRGAAERILAFTDLVARQKARFESGDLAGAARALVAEVDLYSHARASVVSLEAGARKVEAIDGVIRSLESHAARAGAGHKASLAAYLSKLALDAREEEPPGGDGVALLTLHAAKGLEFPVVFLVGCEEGFFPCASMKGEARDLDEERRLAYVGFTRARERLVLTRAEQRARRGKLEARTPSRFLGDLPAGAFEPADPRTAASPGESASRSAEVLAELRARLAAGK